MARKISFNVLVHKFGSSPGAKTTAVKNIILKKGHGFTCYRTSSKCVINFLNNSLDQAFLMEGIRALKQEQQGIEKKLKKPLSAKHRKQEKKNLSMVKSEIDYLNLLIDKHSLLTKKFDSSKIKVLAISGFETTSLSVGVSPSIIFVVERNKGKYIGAFIPHLRGTSAWTQRKSHFSTKLISLCLSQLTDKLNCEIDPNLVLCIHNKSGYLYSLDTSTSVSDVEFREHLQSLKFIWKSLEEDPIIIQRRKELDKERVKA